MEIRAHNFKKVHFGSPTWCNYCKNFIWGLGKQGFKCTNEGCGFSVHKKKDCVTRAQKLACLIVPLGFYEADANLMGAPPPPPSDFDPNDDDDDSSSSSSDPPPLLPSASLSPLPSAGSSGAISPRHSSSSVVSDKKTSPRKKGKEKERERERERSRRSVYGDQPVPQTSSTAALPSELDPSLSVANLKALAAPEPPEEPIDPALKRLLEDLQATKKEMEEESSAESAKFSSMMEERQTIAFQIDSLKQAIIKLYDNGFTL
eukprot:TRINITY_DN5338_c0_g1_i1.p1 TRINITY_DN5338_c0_g1~~TRINITY_DN5338_c0_g1_i1.p1  ORF type:complete len:291 (+),score=140.16 TRINITY_DN5338_c0_g1_i1:93-875(+)